MECKTHWLQNPNKNYLGHWDLPNGKDVTLTIKSASWEGVTDPITRKTDSKRVIRFKESDKWVKPLICNQVNAQMILNVTGEKFMEDCEGKKLRLSVSRTKVRGEYVDCVRVKNVSQKELSSSCITKRQIASLKKQLLASEKKENEFLEAMQLTSLAEVPSVKFEPVMLRLKQIEKEIKNANN